jgi:hypothetical protein
LTVSRSYGTRWEQSENVIRGRAPFDFAQDERVVQPLRMGSR